MWSRRPTHRVPWTKETAEENSLTTISDLESVERRMVDHMAARLGKPDEDQAAP